MRAGARAVVVLFTAAVLVGVPARTTGWQAVELVVAFAAFVVVLANERREPTLRARHVVVPAVVLLGVAVLAPPVGSRDVWSYAMYGRIVAVHHVSPYRVPPSAFRRDPMLRRVSPVWRDTRSVYGPAFTAVSAAGMWFFDTHALTARLFFQLVAALAAGAAMWLVWRETSDPAAMAAIGLNPLLIIAVVNGGHSDALVGLGVLAGVALVVHRRPWLAGLVLGLATLVKVVALLPLAAVAVWALLRPRGVRTALAVGLAGVAVIGVGYAAAGGRAALAPVTEARLHMTDASPWDEVRVALTARGIADGERGRVAGLAARKDVAIGVELAVLALGVAVVVGRRRDPSPVLVAGGAGLAYMLLGGYVLPWYVAWAAFVLALRWRSALTWTVLGQGALLQLAYLPDPHTGGTIMTKPVRAFAERAELVLRHDAMPMVSAAIAITVMMTMCFASSRSTSGTSTGHGASGAARS